VTPAISTTSRRELSSSFFFFFFDGKAPKEIHAILTEILACFLCGRAKDLLAPQYCLVNNIVTKLCYIETNCCIVSNVVSNESAHNFDVLLVSFTLVLNFIRV